MSSTRPFLVKAGNSRTGTRLHIFGDLVDLKITGEDTNGAYAVIEDVTPPDGGPPLHMHTREDEWFYVLDGQYKFEVDGRLVEAGPGDFSYGPRNVPHTFQNVGPAPGRMLVMAQPAGLDKFLGEVAAVASREMPNPVVLLRIFSKYGIQFLGPPLLERQMPSPGG